MTMIITNYQIVFERNMLLLTNTVNGLLADNWQPLGGMIVEIHDDRRIAFYQTMVQYVYDN